MDARSLRFVGDEFDEFVAEDDAARRRREVFAQHEALAVDLTRLAAVGTRVFEEVLHAAHQAGAAGVVALL